jgi:hypothetical protein
MRYCLLRAKRGVFLNSQEHYRCHGMKLNQLFLNLLIKTKDQAVIPLVHEETITLITRPELKDFLQSLDDAEVSKNFQKEQLKHLH